MAANTPPDTGAIAAAAYKNGPLPYFTPRSRWATWFWQGYTNGTAPAGKVPQQFFGAYSAGVMRKKQEPGIVQATDTRAKLPKARSRF